MNARPTPLPSSRRARSVAALVALACAPLLYSQSKPQQRIEPATAPSAILPRMPEPAGALSAEQKAFLNQLALLNARQLALAGEASGRATQSATRDFADWVRREHETFAAELATLAKLLGDETAARVEVPPIQERPAWANRDDSGYDEGYVRATAELAGRMVERLRAVQDSSQSAVAAFAKKNLPGLASRIQRAEDLQKTL